MKQTGISAEGICTSAFFHLMSCSEIDEIVELQRIGGGAHGSTGGTSLVGEIPLSLHNGVNSGCILRGTKTTDYCSNPIVSTCAGSVKSHQVNESTPTGEGAVQPPNGGGFSDQPEAMGRGGDDDSNEDDVDEDEDGDDERDEEDIVEGDDRPGQVAVDDLYEHSWLRFNPLDEPSERELVCEVAWRRVWRCLLRRTTVPAPARDHSAAPLVTTKIIPPTSSLASVVVERQPVVAGIGNSTDSVATPIESRVPAHGRELVGMHSDPPIKRLKVGASIEL